MINKSFGQTSVDSEVTCVLVFFVSVPLNVIIQIKQMKMIMSKAHGKSKLLKPQSLFHSYKIKRRLKANRAQPRCTHGDERKSSFSPTSQQTLKESKRYKTKGEHHHLYKCASSWRNQQKERLKPVKRSRSTRLRIRSSDLHGVKRKSVPLSDG